MGGKLNAWLSMTPTTKIVEFMTPVLLKGSDSRAVTIWLRNEHVLNFRKSYSILPYKFEKN